MRSALLNKNTDNRKKTSVSQRITYVMHDKTEVFFAFFQAVSTLLENTPVKKDGNQ
jgi:hypothetical protein